MTTPSAPSTTPEVEESDTCGDLVEKMGFGSRVLQRRSEIFPLTLSPRPEPKKGRRLSDPGRLVLNTFRAGGEGDAVRSREALLSFPSGKIPDPRLEAIRSLSPTAVEAAGEEGEAAVVVYRSSRSRRSSHHPFGGGSLLPDRLANKRLSLPNASSASCIGLSTELGEAMGAVARADGGGSVPSPPPTVGATGLLSKDAYGFRRRRSISLECSRLEAILEENSHRQTRKYSLPPKSSSDPNEH